ncbi:serine/threonine-protein kinase PpkA [Gammaproteobacteria bacterium]
MEINIRIKKILVIDDMASVRSALRYIFISMGATKVDFAADGDEALRLMASTSYEIILCDYILEVGRDGMQILEEAKQRQLIGLSTIFIMITGEARLSMVLGVIEYRPDDYLVKPITRHMLEDRLSLLIARKAVLIDIERAVRDGDIARAVAMTQEKLQAHPNHALDLLRVRAELQLRLEQFNAASETLNIAACIRETFWVKLHRGQILFYLKDYAGAEQIFKALIFDNDMNTEAYDWLARVQQATNKHQAALETLATATQISPRSIRRTQTLGALGLRTGNIRIAEQAYRNAVRLGRFSIYGNPNDNAHLSQIFMDSDNSKEALRTIKEARKQYINDHKATLVLAIAEALTYEQLDLKDAAIKSMTEANIAYQNASSSLAPDLAMEFAKLCHFHCNDKQATEIMSDVVNRYVEDIVLMKKAQETYNAMGMMQAGEKLINEIREKVVATNNEGVRLVRGGRIHEAIIMLEKAARDMPKNPTINMNAARVLLLAMEKTDRPLDLLARAKAYLDSVSILQGVDDQKFQSLRNILVKFEKNKRNSMISKTTAPPKTSKSMVIPTEDPQSFNQETTLNDLSFIKVEPKSPAPPKTSKTMVIPTEDRQSFNQEKTLNFPIPGYIIDRLIGQGGMATVYLATQESLSRPVAMKLLRNTDNSQFSSRFLNEGRMIAGLTHTNIITIYDIGIHDNYHYISMEYVKGGDLKSRINSGITLDAAFDIFEKIGSCLGFVHSKGLVHRDIKPANILFRADGTPLLSDFGIAKQLQVKNDLTTTGMIIGSPHYLSPEQAKGLKDVDGRTDLYGLGVVFYEMLTRKKPFESDSHMSVIFKHLTEPVPKLPAEYAKFQPFLERLMAKDYADRFATAEEMLDALRVLRTG